MAQIQPFPGIRAHANLANAVIAPPYDVLSEAEARAIAKEKPQSFIHVTRSEVALAEGCDSHSKEAYEMARKQLQRLMEEGALVQEESACFYLYSQRMGNHEQHGLMATCSVAEYDAGKIKKHEYTRPDKEQDRVNHIEATQAQTGLVFLIHKKTETINSLREKAKTLSPLFEVTSDDGVVHRLRRIDSQEDIAAWQSAFGELNALYIADGHHRSAAASRVSASKKAGGSSGFFLAGIFPEDELQVLPYNRLVADLNGRNTTEFLEELKAGFIVTPTEAPAPAQRGQVHMYIDQVWYQLQHRAETSTDPVDCLDVAVLQDHLLSPILGINDPRRDTRIQFVGGIRGTDALEQAVNTGKAAVAFSLFPTGLDQLLSVADADQVMPPKSTWFEPKLAGGIVLHALD